MNDVPARPKSPIVIGGCGRSGTTLFRLMLDAHPNICCGPESKLFLPHKGSGPSAEELATKFGLDREVVAALRTANPHPLRFAPAFFEAFRISQGARRWAEKTPRNVLHLDDVWASVPHATFVHVVRDGRDVVCSLRTHPRHLVVEGELVPTGNRHPLGPCIDRWVTDVSAGLEHADDLRYLEVRYEDVVTDPRGTFAAVLTAIGEPWDEAVLQHNRVDRFTHDPVHFPQNPEAVLPVTTSRLSRWSDELEPDELEQVMERLGPLLDQLGYI